MRERVVKFEDFLKFYVQFQFSRLQALVLTILVEPLLCMEEEDTSFEL